MSKTLVDNFISPQVMGKTNIQAWTWQKKQFWISSIREYGWIAHHYQNKDFHTLKKKLNKYKQPMKVFILMV